MFKMLKLVVKLAISLKRKSKTCYNFFLSKTSFFKIVSIHNIIRAQNQGYCIIRFQVVPLKSIFDSKINLKSYLVSLKKI